MSLFEASKVMLQQLIDELDSNEPIHSAKKPHYMNEITSTQNCTAVKTQAQKHRDSFPFQGTEQGHRRTGDGQGISCPPQALLESYIECFLQEINANLALFDETKLRGTIVSYYSGRSKQQNESLNLCFNNILLLALGLRLRVAAISGSDRDDLSGSFLVSLLNNARRGLQKLELLSEPSLVNVQALGTLVCDS